jgi:hypothetical protein
MVIIIPDLSGGSFEGDTFNVKLSGLEDLFGNVISDPVSWSFVIKADPTPPEDADLDLDAIQNSTDNCPWSYNPVQEDLDLDGKGDVCDDDLDGDGVLNSVDNCMKTINPDQKDENEDNVGDVCQDNTGIFNPGSIEGFKFYANHPNPFSESTILSYTIPVECYIIMRVFDVVGNEVAMLVNEKLTPGTWEVTWNAINNNEGIYYCNIYAEDRNSKNLVMKTIKMAKIK